MRNARPILIVTALVGCGRISFDPLDDSATGGGTMLQRAITVTNPSTESLVPGYTIRVALDDSVQSGELGEPSRLRVLDSTMPLTSLGLDRVLDEDPPGEQPAVFFILTATIAPGGQGTYWLLEADPALTPPSDPKKVFPLYDDFRGGALGATWLPQGAPMLTSGGLRLPPGDNGVTTVAASDGIASAAVFEARVTLTNTTGLGQDFWLGFQHTGDFGTGPPFLNWVGRDGDVHPWVQTGVNLSCPGIPLDGLPHVYRIERATVTENRYLFDGLAACQLVSSDATDYSIQLRNASSSTLVMTVDWVRVRALETPEPVVILGPAVPAP